MDLEKHMGKGGPIVGTVNGRVTRGLGIVNVLTTRAVELYGLGVGNVAQTHREERLIVAEDTGTAPKVGFLVFLELYACIVMGKIKIVECIFPQFIIF